MYLRGNLGPGTSEDYRLGTAVGILLAAYAGFFLALYWLMQPSVAANPGLAAYRPPPKTVVHYADSPWVPPAPSQALAIPAATDPAAEAGKRRLTGHPTKRQKKETRKVPRAH